jgi:hypothetical protein
MTIRMTNLERLALAEMAEFVTTSRHVSWSAVGPDSVYGVIERVLKAQQYRRLSKGQRGIVKRFLAKITGMSRTQLTRLIRRWMDTRRIERSPARQPNFPRRYNDADIASLAEVDAAHEDLSGPVVRHLCQRAWVVFGDEKFQRLAGISASHIYNLRRSRAYQKIRVRVEHTQGSTVSIGERRRPEPQGKPGYLRVDTVAPGAARRPSRRVSPQRRRYGDAVGSGGLHGDHQRTASHSRVGSDAASVSLSDRRFSLRQRVRVSQLPGIMRILSKASANSPVRVLI